MKDENQIRKRLRQLKFRAFQKRARVELKAVPPNCAFNRETSTEFPDGSPFRICGLALEQEPQEFLGCNETLDAALCEAFVHHTDKAAIKVAVEQDMADPEVGPRDYPVVAVLMWVLDEETAEVEGPELAEPVKPIRWWQVRRWFRRRSTR